MPDIVCLYEAKDILGEGPIWNDREASLYWCDNIGARVHRLDPATGAVRTWQMAEEIGSLVFRERGGIVGGMKSGFAFLDLDAGAVEIVAAV